MNLKDIINLYDRNAKLSSGRIAYLLEICNAYDVIVSESDLQKYLWELDEKDRFRKMDLRDIFDVPFSL